METKEKTKIRFERRSQNQRLHNYSNIENDFRKFDNEQFVVPWQMENKTKKELLLD